MSILIEQDIRSIPHILRQTFTRVQEQGVRLQPFLQGPVAFLGCGSSYCIALAAASLYESSHAEPSQAIMGSEYHPRAGWNHVVISRTGQTTELIEAMQHIRDAGGKIALIRGDSGSPAEALANVVLPLDFAPEQGVIQTRFIAAALYALRLLIGGEAALRTLADLPEQVELGLNLFDPARPGTPEHIVFLGRGWRYGLARMAMLNLQETTLLAPEGHQTLEYRHGPIAAADTRSLVWCFDAPEDATSSAVLNDVRQTGAIVYCPSGDPLVTATQAYMYALYRAAARGIDPDHPRNLARAIVLSSEKAS